MTEKVLLHLQEVMSTKKETIGTWRVGVGMDIRQVPWGQTRPDECGVLMLREVAVEAKDIKEAEKKAVEEYLAQLKKITNAYVIRFPDGRSREAF